MDQIPEPPAPVTESVPPAPAGQEDLLGRRSGAALIDVALLTGVFVIFSLMVGEIRTESGPGWGFYADLNPAWWLVYLAVVLVYYFGFEVAVGQTVGKRLLGLRVTRADGSRPSVAAIAMRTLLRLVDWLPALYLCDAGHWRAAPTAGRSCGQDEGGPGAAGRPSRPRPGAGGAGCGVAGAVGLLRQRHRQRSMDHRRGQDRRRAR